MFFTQTMNIVYVSTMQSTGGACINMCIHIKKVNCHFIDMVSRRYAMPGFRMSCMCGLDILYIHYLWECTYEKVNPNTGHSIKRQSCLWCANSMNQVCFVHESVEHICQLVHGFTKWTYGCRWRVVHKTCVYELVSFASMSSLQWLWTLRKKKIQHVDTDVYLSFYPYMYIHINWKIANYHSIFYHSKQTDVINIFFSYVSFLFCTILLEQVNQSILFK
jgi:hypothetical protein